MRKPSGRANRYDAHLWAFYFFKYNCDYTSQARDRIRNSPVALQVEPFVAKKKRSELK